MPKNHRDAGSRMASRIDGLTSRCASGLTLILVIAFAGFGGGEATSSGKAYEVRCKEPLPLFTLGENSHPTKAQEAVLCTCIWESLGGWERQVSEKFAKGKDSEVSWLHERAFPS